MAVFHAQRTTTLALYYQVAAALHAQTLAQRHQLASPLHATVHVLGASFYRIIPAPHGQHVWPA